MNGVLRDRLLLAAAAVAGVAISYTLLTQMRDRTGQAVRAAVTRPPDLKLTPAPAVGLPPGGTVIYTGRPAGGVEFKGLGQPAQQPKPSKPPKQPK